MSLRVRPGSAWPQPTVLPQSSRDHPRLGPSIQNPETPLAGPGHHVIPQPHRVWPWPLSRSRLSVLALLWPHPGPEPQPPCSITYSPWLLHGVSTALHPCACVLLQASPQSPGPVFLHIHVCLRCMHVLSRVSPGSRVPLHALACFSTGFPRPCEPAHATPRMPVLSRVSLRGLPGSTSLRVLSQVSLRRLRALCP